MGYGKSYEDLQIENADLRDQLHQLQRDSVPVESAPRDIEIARLRAKLQPEEPTMAKRPGELAEALLTAAQLRKENEKLRAELETLRPKPVVVLRYVRTRDMSFMQEPFEGADLKLTFHDVLVSAEVIK